MLEKGWTGTGNTGRHTTIVRCDHLLRANALFYEPSLKLWQTLSQEPTLARARLRPDGGQRLAQPDLPGRCSKTVKWPASFWTGFYEHLIRRAAGLGEAPRQPDPDRYDKRHTVATSWWSAAAGLAAGRAGARMIWPMGRRASAVECDGPVNPVGGAFSWTA